MTSTSVTRAAALREAFCARLKAAIPDIIARWETEVRRAPWDSLSDVDRIDHLPAYLDALIDWCFCLSEDARHAKRFVDTAAQHGVQRRDLNLDYDIIMEESAALRRAIWSVAAPTFEDRYDMVSIDSALTVGLMASLRGYAKPELTQNGQWEAGLARLAADWSYTLAR